MQPALAPALQPLQPLQPSPQENVAEQSLREHLLAQVSPQASGARNTDGAIRTPSSASPHEQNIDPAIAGSTLEASPSNDSGGEDNPDGSGKKGSKRELSTSKRAAQNRAAQRAFRQRKEGYIKKLEEQVRNLHALEENYKAIQAENYQLRDYIINLQSRLIESQGEFPQPPSNIDLVHPQQEGGRQSAPTAPMAPSVAASQLQASAAQAVADLAGSGGKHQHDEAAFLTNNGYPSKRLKDEAGGAPAAAPPRTDVPGMEANGQGVSV
ncbi:MAG: hypothetical protein M1832_004170 [Thelocarpon impressellum]|nr:MAG: hypothetical protein M1832_004170 [Thelocarpon impressellum]